MTVLTVGPNSSYRSIAAADLAAGPGDTIILESGYGNEVTTITKGGLTIDAGVSSTGIVLSLAPGIAVFTLTGAAPINVGDATDGNMIVGNAGNNIITVTDGADAVDGGLGVDRLVVDYHLATGAITGDTTSNISEAGGSHQVTITDGTFEHFTILTGSGADTITTGAGDDIINVGQGANTVTAGQGANVIRGGDGADTITASDGGNFVDAGDGTNIVTTGAGTDIIFTGSGADTITAGGGDDVITLRGGADIVHGEAGNDRLVVDYSTSVTSLTMNAPVGTLAGGYTGQTADLSGNHASFDGIESFIVYGGSDNDLITTGAGNDILVGGQGGDILTGGGGQDFLIGGAGADVFVYTSVTDSNQAAYDGIVDFTTGVDKIDVSAVTAGGGAVSINLYGAQTVVAFQGASGPAGMLLTNGQVQGFDLVTGADVIAYIGGSYLAESIYGSNGRDVIFGQGGNDSIAGLGGADSLSGGDGADTFYWFAASDSSYAAYDTVTDFTSGVDKIDLRSVHTGAADVYGLYVRGSDTHLLIDQGGDGIAEMIIILSGVTNVQASDILF